MYRKSGQVDKRCALFLGSQIREEGVPHPDFSHPRTYRQCEILTHAGVPIIESWHLVVYLLSFIQ